MTSFEIQCFTVIDVYRRDVMFSVFVIEDAPPNLSDATRKQCGQIDHLLISQQYISQKTNYTGLPTTKYKNIAETHELQIGLLTSGVKSGFPVVKLETIQMYPAPVRPKERASSSMYLPNSRQKISFNKGSGTTSTIASLL